MLERTTSKSYILLVYVYSCRGNRKGELGQRFRRVTCKAGGRQQKKRNFQRRHLPAYAKHALTVTRSSLPSKSFWGYAIYTR